ncbi:hypothetical protein LSAT2_031897 [Lamellibrachia satsuma]|nr:hypothetical protein LSAT2_031897 [Lamellibrachia satsuma]
MVHLPNISPYGIDLHTLSSKTISLFLFLQIHTNGYTSVETNAGFITDAFFLSGGIDTSKNDGRVAYRQTTEGGILQRADKGRQEDGVSQAHQRFLPTVINRILPSRNLRQREFYISVGARCSYHLPDSRKPSAVDVELTTNVGVLGRWIFRVDGNTVVPGRIFNQDVYDCDNNSPCTAANRALGKYYFANINMAKFVQCGAWGQCWIRPCAPGTVFKASISVYNDMQSSNAGHDPGDRQSKHIGSIDSSSPVIFGQALYGSLTAAVTPCRNKQRVSTQLLEGHFTIKPIPQISPRLQRRRMRIGPYDYELVYRPGRELVLAATLSLEALYDEDNDTNDSEDVNALYVESTTESCRKELCELTAQDETLQLVAWHVRQGWPEHKKLCPMSREPELLIPTPVPEYPFQKVGAVLFALDGIIYLLTVDYYSKWLSVVLLADFKTPEVLVSDNGPQFGCHESTFHE